MVPLVSSSSSYHYIVYHDCRYYISWGRRGRDRMVVGFTPLNLWFRIPLRLGVLDTTLCDKVCQWLAAGRWFSPGTLVSPTNKTDRRDIAEILLKVALNSMTTLYFAFYIWFVAVLWSLYSVYFTFYIWFVAVLWSLYSVYFTFYILFVAVFWSLYSVYFTFVSFLRQISGFLWIIRYNDIAEILLKVALNTLTLTLPTN